MKCKLCDNHSQMEMIFIMFPRFKNKGWDSEYCFSCAEKKFREMANLFKRHKNEDRHFITESPIWIDELTSEGN